MRGRLHRCGVAVFVTIAFVLGVSLTAPTAERHPQIHAAMRALRQAEQHLERAEHHFGGHRAKALELVKQAENELKEALAVQYKSSPISTIEPPD